MLDNKAASAYLRDISPDEALAGIRTMRDAVTYMAARRRQCREQMQDAQYKYIVMPNTENFNTLIQYTVAYGAFGAQGLFGRQLKGRVFPDDPKEQTHGAGTDSTGEGNEGTSGKNGRRRDLLLRGVRGG